MLLYEPIYNYALDRAFHKRKGKYVNPLRYGLTQFQINELKRLNQWKIFLTRWNSLRESYLKKHSLTCMLCGDTKQTGVWILSTRICASCCDEIKQLTKGYFHV